MKRYTSWYHDALLSAVENKNPEVLKFLISQRADVNSEGFKAITPFIKAASLNDATKMDILKNAGANINAQNYEGKTALHFAAEKSNALAVTKLLGWGVELEAKDKSGNTALLLSIAQGSWSPRNAEAIAALSQAGANVLAKTKDGTTVLELAKAVQVEPLLRHKSPEDKILLSQIKQISEFQNIKNAMDYFANYPDPNIFKAQKIIKESIKYHEAIDRLSKGEGVNSDIKQEIDQVYNITQNPQEAVNRPLRDTLSHPISRSNEAPTINTHSPRSRSNSRS